MLAWILLDFIELRSGFAGVHCSLEAAFIFVGCNKCLKYAREVQTPSPGICSK
ncbi:MAG: hypothetical protein ACI845_003252 [Gammaproteobacteria bacterium]|jgi:hypothetical protein